MPHFPSSRRCGFFVAVVVALACLAAPPAAQADQTRKVWPLFYGTDDEGKPTGRAMEMTVGLAPSNVGEARVGFFESEFMGAGEQWRAAGWMASVVSALYAGKPPSLWRVYFDVPGNIDGPSAGGLMTSTVLSLVLGQPMLPDVTMTGAINPDGSIGPVGGIYYKLAGAKAAGMRKVLIPAGGSTEKLGDGKSADLIARGRELGLQVVPVADVAEAYQHLTGRALATLPDDGRAFRLPTRTNEALQNSYRRWAVKYDEATANMRANSAAVPKRFHPRLQKIWDSAQAQRAKAQAALNHGAPSAAMQLMYGAAVTADIGAYLCHLYIGHDRGGVDGMARVLSGFLISDQFLNQFRAKLSAQRAHSVTDLITLAEAFAYYDAAVGVHFNSGMILGRLQKEKDPEKVFVILEQATLGEAMARNFSHFVDDLLHMGMRYPGPKLPAGQALADWAQAMRLAAGGNLGYIKKAIIDPAAEELGVAPAVLMNKVLGNDYHYLLANATYFASQAMAGDMPDDTSKGAALLGGSVASFGLSSMVVAKYYSLGAQTNAEGELVKLGDPGRLEPMLGSARAQLRQVILAAQAQGCTPIVPIFHLQTADYMARADMSLSDRLTGMGECWMGSTFGRLMTALGRQP